MIIGVDTRYLTRGSIDPVTPVTGAMLRAMALEHAEDRFFLFSDREWSDGTSFPPNIAVVLLPLRGRGYFGRRFWLDVTLPNALRQYHVEALLLPDGVASMRTTVPQLVVWKKTPASAKRRSSFSRLLSGDREKKSMQSAHTVLVSSPYEKEVMMSRFKTDTDRVRVVGTTIDEIFQPADTLTRERIKQAYTGGREFFIFLDQLAGKEQLVTLLKAFSLFKKRQRTSWKLLLPGAYASSDKVFTNLVKTYRYKEDLVLPGAVPKEEEARILGSSYAAIAGGKATTGEILCAMKCGVPCLAQVTAAVPGNQDAGLVPIDWSAPARIAEALMLIYKDEQLHAKLAAEALERASEFTPQKTATMLWKCLVERVGTSA